MSLTYWIEDFRQRRACRRMLRQMPPAHEHLSAEETVAFLFSEAAMPINAWQIQSEFLELARIVEARRPRTLLEIGTADGGTLFAHARLAAEDALLVSIDLPRGNYGGGYPAWRAPVYHSFAGPNQKIVLLREDSHDPRTERQLEQLLDGRRFDYCFIDGDHSFEGARQDFELCRRLVAPDGIIAFHDIAEAPNRGYTEERPDSGWGVHDVWKRVREEYRHAEFIADPQQEGYGIGVLFMPSAHTTVGTGGPGAPGRS
jgi:predicted O-methyltransferase YrrM